MDNFHLIQGFDPSAQGGETEDLLMNFNSTTHELDWTFKEIKDKYLEGKIPYAVIDGMPYSEDPSADNSYLYAYYLVSSVGYIESESMYTLTLSIAVSPSGTVTGLAQLLNFSASSENSNPELVVMG